jgi:hypothetical protein
MLYWYKRTCFTGAKLRVLLAPEALHRDIVRMLSLLALLAQKCKYTDATCGRLSAHVRVLVRGLQADGV